MAFGHSQILSPWTIQVPYNLPLAIRNNTALPNLTPNFTVEEFPNLMELIPSDHPFLYQDYLKYDWRRVSMLNTLTGTLEFFNPFWNLFKALNINANDKNKTETAGNTTEGIPSAGIQTAGNKTAEIKKAEPTKKPTK